MTDTMPWRLQIAAMALAGNCNVEMIDDFSFEKVARVYLRMADAMLAEHARTAQKQQIVIDEERLLVALREASKSPTQRYVDNGDGTVTDTTTFLMWSKEDIGGRQSWEPAEKACRALTLAGFSDWRLPTRAELLTLVDETRHEPAIDVSAFPACRSSWYWSRTPTAWAPSCAWLVLFDSGYASYSRRGATAFVRAVRSARPSQ